MSPEQAWTCYSGQGPTPSPSPQPPSQQPRNQSHHQFPSPEWREAEAPGATPRNTRALGARPEGHIPSHRGQNVTAGHGPFPVGGRGCWTAAGGLGLTLARLAPQPTRGALNLDRLCGEDVPGCIQLPPHPGVRHDEPGQGLCHRASGLLRPQEHLHPCHVSPAPPPHPCPRQAETLTDSFPRVWGAPNMQTCLRESERREPGRASKGRPVPPLHLTTLPSKPPPISQCLSGWSLLLGGSCKPAQKFQTPHSSDTVLKTVPISMGLCKKALVPKSRSKLLWGGQTSYLRPLSVTVKAEHWKDFCKTSPSITSDIQTTSLLWQKVKRN